FTFLTVTPYSVPLNVTQGGGCANFQSAGASGFVQSGSRTSSTGDLLFTYYVNKSQITKRYGTNNGQQFIPLCAGAAKVDAAGNVMPCTAQGAPYAPWRGKELGADGKFDGNVIDAVCDVATGMYWSVMGSFQDYTNPDPAMEVRDDDRHAWRRLRSLERFRDETQGLLARAREHERLDDPRVGRQQLDLVALRGVELPCLLQERACFVDVADARGVPAEDAR